MTYVFACILGLVLTYIFTFATKKLAFSVGAIAYAGGRSIHREPTPLLGGLAIYMAFLLTSLFIVVWGDPSVMSSVWRSGWKLVGLFLGTTCILVVGLVDDLKPMRARSKLAGQIVSALLCVGCGYTIHAVDLPFMKSFALGWFGPVVFVMWVVSIVNAINLIDGMDGLASTVSLFAAIGNGLIAWWLGHPFIALFSFILAGSLVGFLFHNFPPARIFLGDTGSMLLGFLLAVIVVESNTQKRGTALVLLAPCLLLGFSLLDVFLSVIRRALRGKPIMSSDLGHIHHRLMNRFKYPRRVLLVVGVFSFFTMCISIGIQYCRLYAPLLTWPLLSVAGVGLFVFVFILGYLRIDWVRAALHDRVDNKFMFSLLAYLPKALKGVDSKEELIGELDWVCHALKPYEVAVYDESNDLVYFYTPNQPMTEEQPFHQESFRKEEVILRWKIPIRHNNPKHCDLRLIWHRLLALFVTRYCVLHESSEAYSVGHHTSEGQEVPNHPYQPPQITSFPLS